MIVFVVTWHDENSSLRMKVFDLEEDALNFALEIRNIRNAPLITRCKVHSAAWD